MSFLIFGRRMLLHTAKIRAHKSGGVGVNCVRPQTQRTGERRRPTLRECQESSERMRTNQSTPATTKEYGMPQNRQRMSALKIEPL